MPVIRGANLELRTANDQRTSITVRYSVTFSRFERFLVENGLSFVEAIRVQGVDAGGSPAATTLHVMPLQRLPVLEGDGDAPTLMRTRTLIVSRSSLQEDTHRGDDDEIRCSITIAPRGIPEVVTEHTDQEALTG